MLAVAILVRRFSRKAEYSARIGPNDDGGEPPGVVATQFRERMVSRILGWISCRSGRGPGMEKEIVVREIERTNPWILLPAQQRGIVYFVPEVLAA